MGQVTDQTPDDDMDDDLDAEIARIEAEAEVRKAELRGRRAAGGPVRDPEPEPERDERDERDDDAEDFDAFWREADRRGVRLSNVFGADIELPAQLPLRFELEARRLAGSESIEDVQHLVGVLFGDDALSTWIDRGMDVEQFGVLLMWGAANAAGQHMTLAEARAEYDKQEAAKGKAPVPVPNRADRRASKRRKGGG